MKEVSAENFLLGGRNRLRDRADLLTNAVDQWIGEHGGLRQDEFDALHAALDKLHDLCLLLARD